MATYGLSEEDRKILRDLLSRDARRVVNTQNRYGPQYDEGTSPEVYLALVPPDGIPGLPSWSSVPSYADCILSAISHASTPPAIEELVGYTHRVYNIFPEDIAGDSRAIVLRDKAGDWYAIGTFGTPVETGTGTGTETGTGTSSATATVGTGTTGTGTGTGTGTTGTGTEGCSPITLTERDIRCEDGDLNIYVRVISLNIVDGCLSKSTGEWIYESTQGCCDCDIQTGTGSGTSSVGTGTATSTAGTASSTTSTGTATAGTATSTSTSTSTSTGQLGTGTHAGSPCCANTLPSTLHATLGGTTLGTVTLAFHVGGGAGGVPSGEDYWEGWVSVPGGAGTGLGACSAQTLWLRFWCPGASLNCTTFKLQGSCDHTTWLDCAHDIGWSCLCSPLSVGPYSVGGPTCNISCFPGVGSPAHVTATVTT